MADAVEPLVMLCSRCYGAGFVDTGTCHHCGGVGSYSEEPNPAPQRLIRVEPVSVDLSDEMHPQLYVLHPDGSLSPAHVSGVEGKTNG
jgi:hypothetical protein